jgi:hypothetical protein
MITAPFFPQYGTGALVTPGAASASSTVQKGTKNVILTNGGLNVCYVKLGQSGISASTADFPVLAGTQVALSKDQDFDTIAYISAAGTTLHIMNGEGW